MNFPNQKGNPTMNQGNNMNKQEIMNLAQISSNNSKTNKDPILNQQLNNASTKEKNLLNSLILSTKIQHKCQNHPYKQVNLIQIMLMEYLLQIKII